MLTNLQKARAIELSKNGRNICLADDLGSSLPGLYKRGLVNTKTVTLDGKEILCVYITNPGIDFLDRYKIDANKLGQ